MVLQISDFFEALENLPALREGRIGAICCSRPTNPTGNVLTDEEMANRPPEQLEAFDKKNKKDKKKDKKKKGGLKRFKKWLKGVMK